MTSPALPRRAFLLDAGRLAAAGWLAAQPPALAACGPDAPRRGAFVTLTPAEARAMRAVAARILPSDDGTPGAEEAGAVRYVDRALGTARHQARLPVVRAGLADLDARARALGASDGFAALDAARQDALLRAVETTPFFAAARDLVVAGTFADPTHGGNRDGVGWRLVGMEHRPRFDAPFGWYDARMLAEVAPAAAASAAAARGAA